MERYLLWELKFQRTKVQGSESSLGSNGPGSELAGEWKGQGAKAPGNELATERKGHGLKCHRANWPGSYWPIRSRERIGLGAKRLGTKPSTLHTSSVHWSIKWGMHKSAVCILWNADAEKIVDWHKRWNGIMLNGMSSYHECRLNLFMGEY